MADPGGTAPPRSLSKDFLSKFNLGHVPWAWFSKFRKNAPVLKFLSVNFLLQLSPSAFSFSFPLQLSSCNFSLSFLLQLSRLAFSLNCSHQLSNSPAQQLLEFKFPANRALKSSHAMHPAPPTEISSYPSAESIPSRFISQACGEIINFNLQQWNLQFAWLTLHLALSS